MEWTREELQNGNKCNYSIIIIISIIICVFLRWFDLNDFVRTCGFSFASKSNFWLIKMCCFLRPVYFLSVLQIALFFCSYVLKSYQHFVTTWIVTNAGFISFSKIELWGWISGKFSVMLSCCQVLENVLKWFRLRISILFKVHLVLKVLFCFDWSSKK